MKNNSSDLKWWLLIVILSVLLFFYIVNQADKIDKATKPKQSINSSENQSPHSVINTKKALSIVKAKAAENDSPYSNRLSNAEWRALPDPQSDGWYFVMAIVPEWKESPIWKVYADNGNVLYLSDSSYKYNKTLKKAKIGVADLSISRIIRLFGANE